MASEMMLIDPLIIPVNSLRRINRELEKMDNRAILILSDIIQDLVTLTSLKVVQKVPISLFFHAKTAKTFAKTANAIILLSNLLRPLRFFFLRSLRELKTLLFSHPHIELR